MSSPEKPRPLDSTDNGTFSKDLGGPPEATRAPRETPLASPSSTDPNVRSKDREHDDGYGDVAGVVAAAVDDQGGVRVNPDSNSQARASVPTEHYDANLVQSGASTSQNSNPEVPHTNTQSTRQAPAKITTDEEWNEKEILRVPTQGHHASLSDFDGQIKEGESLETKPEIEDILQQFGKSQGSTTAPLTSPKSAELPVFQYPVRSSSLGASETPTSQEPLVQPRTRTASETESLKHISQPPLPDPDPEPDLPFDFHRFLEQLRHRTADPVAKFLRSFLIEFGKKQWQVHEQVKIITDFLAFIAGKMSQCEIWRSVSDAEFDNAREGMEKLVMNRLYNQTFSPEIPSPEPTRKGRKSGVAPSSLSGRKGQHQEDVERDEVLAQKVRIYGWICEDHLDIKPFGDKGRKFLALAQQELVKIRSYRAPRDKVICVLNCCKVIFGYLKNVHTDQSADAFIPLLIYTVLKANPDHLVSNVQYILRFRNQDKLNGEAGYYMSSLLGAVQFIENLDRTNLTISDQEFERNVEHAVSSIAERDGASDAKLPATRGEHATKLNREVLQPPFQAMQKPLPETPPPDDSEENAAVAGLLRTIQKPLSTIGRIFSDDADSGVQLPLRPSTTSSVGQPPSRFAPQSSRSITPQHSDAANAPPGFRVSSEQMHLIATETAARLESADTAEAQRVTRAEHATVVETLSGMFPDLDREIISDVVRMKEGQIGQAVDACLALSR